MEAGALRGGEFALVAFSFPALRLHAAARSKGHMIARGRRLPVSDRFAAPSCRTRHFLRRLMARRFCRTSCEKFGETSRGSGFHFSDLRGRPKAIDKSVGHGSGHCAALSVCAEPGMLRVDEHDAVAVFRSSEDLAIAAQAIHIGEAAAHDSALRQIGRHCRFLPRRCSRRWREPPCETGGPGQTTP